ncbi:MAG: tetratricopeptide repeat protein, partial [Flavobacteriaceae bacterium]
AKTSYYKGDFDWALQQLKVLKTSTSQLIANDALNLHLLINDHILEDSLHVALKKYAKADLQAFQNKNTEAIATLTDILNHHPVNKIVDDALFLQGQLYEQQQQYIKAQKNYERIINTLNESVFVDNALYKLAQLHLHHLNNPKKTLEYLEALLFNHADSIHFIEAQKLYRSLRSDISSNS